MNKSQKISKETLVKSLQDFQRLNGRSPKINDCLPFSYYIYRTRLGPWSQALVSAGLEPNQAAFKKIVETSCTNCDEPMKKLHSDIKRTGNNFCSQSCAATYNNQHKKHGTRRSKLEVWLESQLTTIYPELEIHFNKKDTINSELDIYFPSLSLAVELNGIFHYEPIYGPEKLAKIKNNDNRKFQACLERGIELCTIDSSQLKHFNSSNAQKYLDIIKSVIGF